MRCPPPVNKPAGFGHTIVIQTTLGTVYASVMGKSDISGVGQNDAGALGDLLIKHAPKLGISIIRHD